MDTISLENWLWEAACTIRGPLDAPKFKDYILPLIFLKRLSDVFDDEVAHLAHEFGDRDTAARLVEQDHQLVRFYVPPTARWRKVATTTTGLGQFLTDAVRAVARENPRLSGVIDVTDFNATTAGQRIVDDARLASLVQVLNNPAYRLGLDDVEPDILGRASEYLLRKFAEGQGQSAGEFYTPREVAVLMAHLLDPQPGQAIYDPCCGSGGLLIKCHLHLLETHGRRENGHLKLSPAVAPLQLYGQEINPSTFAMSRMNAFIHDMEAHIALGDTMHRPAFTGDDGRLRRFDLVTANRMWNQKFPPASYENDPYERFRHGIPPSSSADWGWIQHMAASLRDPSTGSGQGGKMAVVLDTGAVSRGSGNQGSNRERNVRRAFVEGDPSTGSGQALVTRGDLVEAVVLLPENLFYNTSAPGIILVIHKARPALSKAEGSHPGEMLLINASKLCAKGRPKNYLTDEHIRQIAGAYRDLAGRGGPERHRHHRRGGAQRL
jgi:type I restriction enzyme M protein